MNENNSKPKTILKHGFSWPQTEPLCDLYNHLYHNNRLIGSKRTEMLRLMLLGYQYEQGMLNSPSAQVPQARVVQQTSGYQEQNQEQQIKKPIHFYEEVSRSTQEQKQQIENSPQAHAPQADVMRKPDHQEQKQQIENTQVGKAENNFSNLFQQMKQSGDIG